MKDILHTVHVLLRHIVIVVHRHFLLNKYSDCFSSKVLMLTKYCDSCKQVLQVRNELFINDVRGINVISVLRKLYFRYVLSNCTIKKYSTMQQDSQHGVETTQIHSNSAVTTINQDTYMYWIWTKKRIYRKRSECSALFLVKICST